MKTSIVLFGSTKIVFLKNEGNFFNYNERISIETENSVLNDDLRGSFY